MIATRAVKSSVIILFFHHLSYSYSFFPSIFESVKTTSIGQEVWWKQKTPALGIHPQQIDFTLFVLRYQILFVRLMFDFMSSVVLLIQEVPRFFQVQKTLPVRSFIDLSSG